MLVSAGRVLWLYAARDCFPDDTPAGRLGRPSAGRARRVAGCAASRGACNPAHDGVAGGPPTRVFSLVELLQLLLDRADAKAGACRGTVALVPRDADPAHEVQARRPLDDGELRRPDDHRSGHRP